MIMDRRVFVKSGALALLALGLPPEFLQRSLLASTTDGARKKTLICVFQRGAVDGLSMVVPFGEKSYYEKRRSIAVAEPTRAAEKAVIDLDGHFGLHPELRPLHDLFERNELSVINAVGSPNPTRSHFDAQDFMESATPGVKTTADGWLNRALHAADHAIGQTSLGQRALRGVAMGAELPKALRGREPTLAIPDLNRFGILGGQESEVERLYRTQHGTVVGNAADGAFEAIDVLRAANLAQYKPTDGVQYPQTPFGRSLSQVAQLIKSGIGVEIAFVDIGGWDTHNAQGGAQGQLANRLRDFGGGIRALYDDLGDRMEDVVILTMSEFGRTVAENGSGGTDHGHANCMFVAGGAVNGGKILGKWPGLAPEQLYEGRDLAVTTDFRDVFAEIASKHLGARDIEKVFPGHTINRAAWRGVITD
jgi:uncharacterized protein (DUF1501 family)